MAVGDYLYQPVVQPRQPPQLRPPPWPGSPSVPRSELPNFRRTGQLRGRKKAGGRVAGPQSQPNWMTFDPSKGTFGFGPKPGPGVSWGGKIPIGPGYTADYTGTGRLQSYQGGDPLHNIDWFKRVYEPMRAAGVPWNLVPKPGSPEAMYMISQEGFDPEKPTITGQLAPPGGGGAEEWRNWTEEDWVRMIGEAMGFGSAEAEPIPEPETAEEATFGPAILHSYFGDEYGF